MASINTGAIVSEIRGSVKDQTYSKNAYGPYVKSKLVQPYSGSGDQLYIRSVIHDLTQYWQNLSDAQRLMWNDPFQNLHSNSSISNPRKLCGFNAFIKCNFWYYWNNFSYNEFPIPPSTMRPSEVTAFTNTVGELSYTYNAYDTEFRVGSLMKATGPISPGIMSLNRSLLKVMNVANSPGIGIVNDITSLWEGYFGALGLFQGKAIWMQFESLDIQTGKFYNSTLVKTIIP